MERELNSESTIESSARPETDTFPIEPAMASTPHDADIATLSNDDNNIDESPMELADPPPRPSSSRDAEPLDAFPPPLTPQQHHHVAAPPTLPPLPEDELMTGTVQVRCLMADREDELVIEMDVASNANELLAALSHDNRDSYRAIRYVGPDGEREMLEDTSRSWALLGLVPGATVTLELLTDKELAAEAAEEDAVQQLDSAEDAEVARLSSSALAVSTFTQPQLFDSNDSLPVYSTMQVHISAPADEAAPDAHLAGRLLTVHIDRSAIIRKKYLGGYRHRNSGAIFHHASTQTTREARFTEADRKWTRETQTVRIKQHSQQSVRDAASQSTRPDLVLDTVRDRTMAPRPYETADEVWERRERAALVVQRYTRGWFARRLAGHARTEMATKAAAEAVRAAAQAAEEEARTIRAIERRMHPKTTGDFALLRREVEAWRQQETRRIKSEGWGAEEEHAALEQLLYKETKLLQTIDKMRVQGQDEVKSDKIAKVLDDMAAPKQWPVATGTVVEVHTPFTTRARELMHLYQGLCTAFTTTEVRLNVLLHVKYTVKEFDCTLTRELVDLIDREADLLNRGRNASTMDGLRKRIANLFLAFVETPEFNPEAARYTIVPPSQVDMMRSSMAKTLPLRRSLLARGQGTTVG